MEYGLSVLGNIRVFRKDKEITGRGRKTFTVTDVWFNVSEKNEDGSFFNKSMNMIFKRDTEKPENNKIINVISGRFMISGDGDFRRMSLFVEAWEYAAAE